MPPQVYQTQRRVAFHETDAAGIVHFACFFLWMEQAEHAFLRSLGFGIFMEWNGDRISWPRVSTRCDYQLPFRFEDEVEMAVRVVRIGKSSVTYRCDFSHKGQPAAVGYTTAVCCKIDPRPQAVSLPPPIREALTPFLHPENDSP